MTPGIDETHDPLRVSWVASADDHPNFPIQNLPLGVFSPSGQAARVGVAIGDRILDLQAVAEAGLITPAVSDALQTPRLNGVMALPGDERLALRRRLSHLLSSDEGQGAAASFLYDAGGCALHVPATIGDYTDFYVGIHHARNIGLQFRPDNPLLPNYKYVPIGYHGRASSVRPSGTPVTRPHGQTKAPNDAAPVFGPCKRLDYELELGVWIGGAGNLLGQRLDIDDAENVIAGFCLLNDWSARDIQAWEYQPLGPFLAKSFQTTISPWIITAEALAPFRIAQPPRPAGDPRPLDYLWSENDQARGSLALDLGVSLLTAAMRESSAPPHRLSHGPASNMYWTVAQIVTHHASNGCNLTPGDLLGTGTISAPDSSGYGSLLEITRGGAEPLSLPGGETRTFLEDGDEVLLSATARAPGYASIGFGDCRAVVGPAWAPPRSVLTP